MLRRTQLCESLTWCVPALLCGILLGCGSGNAPTNSSGVQANQTNADGAAASSNTTAEQTPQAPPQQQNEPAAAPINPRLEIAPDAFAQFGIQGYDSRRLRLFTDIDPTIARGLPSLADAAYEALVSYFGPIPAEAQKAVGYLMADERRFQAAGLLPPNLPEVRHGEQLGSEFWIREQATDYYRRHLMVHELVHWFMRARGQVEAPLWYLEGIAELLAAHKFDGRGQARFSVMPDTPDDFAGFGRIGLIRGDIEAGRLLTLSDVTALATRADFQRTEAYAWSWALCHFLDSHPKYQDRFRELARNGGEDFVAGLERAFLQDRGDLQTEWLLFVDGLQYGYDVERAAIAFRVGTPLERPDEVRHIDVAADRGWQSSGVLLQAGQEYEMAAAGRFTVAQEPKPWVSEPQGISFRYFKGRPVGMLIGAVRRVSAPNADDRSMLDDVAIGTSRRLTPKFDGTLYLRLNDSWSELADNQGSVEVTVSAVAPNQAQ